MQTFSLQYNMSELAFRKAYRWQDTNGIKIMKRDEAPLPWSIQLKTWLEAIQYSINTGMQTCNLRYNMSELAFGKAFRWPETNGITKGKGAKPLFLVKRNNKLHSNMIYVFYLDLCLSSFKKDNTPLYWSQTVNVFDLTLNCFKP